MTDASPSKSPDLTTKEGLLKHLGAKHGHIQSVHVLTGGTANFVYRVTFTDRTPIICKHAATYLSSNTNFSFDSARMDYEARALRHIPAFQSQDLKSVSAVRIFDYDPVAKLLTMDDGGESNLKEAYTDLSLDVKQIAHALATWLANLHVRTREFSLNLDAGMETSQNNNNPIAVAIYRHSYQNLHHALAKFGFDTALANQINEKYGSLLAHDDECVVMGDFWPGNVLVKSSDVDNSTGLTQSNLTVVDWEMVRRGTSATDVAQFAAEAFLLDTYRGNRSLRANFLTAYFRARGNDPRLNREWIKRLAVHWAVHIAFWPTRVHWTDDAGTKKLVETGINVLKAVVDDDMDFVGKSELFRGVEKWEQVLTRS
ncbi:kinase-like domain-containing protein [Paraphoma chrysanthemicola]|uniref:Kinase-like domain-containing protein n=1 Tax=Paraphoma chrysanthemicola TaxID=798071 RepID=A0A8K0R8V9_9PLEO|nr:kinase-like domain-containing protein [Paraphoma chrysanthemicola]